MQNYWAKFVADIDGSHNTSLTERKKTIKVERIARAIKSKKYTNKYCTIFSLWSIIDTDCLPMQDCYLSQINKIHAICNKHAEENLPLLEETESMIIH